MSDDKFSVLRAIMHRSARNQASQNSLPDRFLRDTLHSIISVGNDLELKTVLDNLKAYIEGVYSQGYPMETLACEFEKLTQNHWGKLVHIKFWSLDTGECFVMVLRNAGEASNEGFDPSPLLIAAATLVQHNKAQIRVWSFSAIRKKGLTKGCVGFSTPTGSGNAHLPRSFWG